MIYQSFVFEPLYDIVLLIKIIFLVNFMTEKEIAMAIKDDQSMIIANSFGQEVRVERAPAQSSSFRGGSSGLR